MWDACGMKAERKWKKRELSILKILAIHLYFLARVRHWTGFLLVAIFAPIHSHTHKRLRRGLWLRAGIESHGFGRHRVARNGKSMPSRPSTKCLRMLPHFVGAEHVRGRESVWMAALLCSSRCQAIWESTPLSSGRSLGGPAIGFRIDSMDK